MKEKGVLVHGFNVFDQGKATTTKLLSHLEERNIDSEQFSYGWFGLLGVYFMNPRAAKQLKARVPVGGIGIGHSNGCTLIHIASSNGAPFRKVIYLNPALRADTPLSSHIENALVFHTESDLPVRFARLLRTLAPWAPLGDPLWGDMGAVGASVEKLKEHQAGDYRLASFLHKVTHILDRNRSLLFAARVLFFPIAVSYWILLGPIEFALTYYINNFRNHKPDIKLRIHRKEDMQFIVYSLLLPSVVNLAIVATCLYL